MKLLELKKISKAYTSNIGEFKILDPSAIRVSKLRNAFGGLDWKSM